MEGFKFLHIGGLDSPLAAHFPDGAGKGMLREAGEAVGNVFETVFVTSQAFQGFQCKLAGCQSARLVEGNDVDARERFDGGSAAEKDATPRAAGD